MSVQHVWAARAWAVAFACFVAYACVILLSSPESGVNAFVTLWLYQGLILLSVVIAGARAVLVKKDRLAWTVVAISLACTSFAELYFIAVEPESYPSMSDFGWIAFTPPCTWAWSSSSDGVHAR